jgi:type I restriction enzyme S subunit
VRSTTWIENNRRRIELLEQVARAIYREWFVRFHYPGHEDTALVDSPLGPIPEGWEVRSLFDVAEVGFGFSFKSMRFADNGPFPVIRIRDVPSGITKTFTDEEPGERYRVVDGDVLIGMDGDFHLRQWTGGEAWLNQRVARLRPLGNLSDRHLLLSIEEPIKEWNAAITGTTVAHLGKRHLQQIQIVIPSPDVLAVASEIFDDAAKGECALVQTGRRLAAIRDLLLPKLVTGQIDVSSLDLDAVAATA